MNKDILDFNDIDKIYYEILNRTNNKILCFRWNNCIHYFQSWINRENHKWICVIRNPEDRAISYLKSHNISIQKSLNLSTLFAKKTEKILENKNVLFIYYEDLILNPKKTLSHISNFLNVNNLDNTEKIFNSDGLEYRNETSDLVDKGMDRKKGVKFKTECDTEVLVKACWMMLFFG